MKTHARDMLGNNPDQTEFIDFHLPFGGRLHGGNRWVKLSGMMPREGCVVLDRLGWDACNGSGGLARQMESCRERFGHCPASVRADKIYRARANRRYCKERGIRLSGKALGRPEKETETNRKQLKAEKKQTRQDELDRIPAEGKSGNAKRKGTLGRIMAKLPCTSESVIGGFNVLKNIFECGGVVRFASVVFERKQHNANKEPTPPRGRPWSDLPNEKSRKNAGCDCGSDRF